MVSVTCDGVAVEEPLERWQARVAFEITNAGLYTDDGWVDVYALLGLSLESPADVARVGAWLAGGRDDLLDRFSLELFFAADQHDADTRLAPVPVAVIVPAAMTWTARCRAGPPRLPPM